MSFFLVKQASSVKGGIHLLGDKSIACRSIIISAISRSKTVIENFPFNKDCLHTVKTFKKLGIKITQNQKLRKITVYGNGLCGLNKPEASIFVGDSGTTMRLTLGALAGQGFPVTLTAGKSLTQRPMLRVTAPLRMMGAEICARHIPKTKNLTPNTKFEEYPPITIRGGNLKAITYRMPVASAQVKSAILLAGLYAKGETRVIEPVKTRDHTERMLKLFKAAIKLKKNIIVIKGKKELVSPGRIFIPGDISSASFFMVLGIILPNSRILIKNVNLNHSRAGIIKVLKRMGADIKAKSPCLSGRQEKPKAKSYEPMGDLLIKSSKLNGAVVKKGEVPSLIDELPILMVAACLSRGKSVFEGVSELRAKETDRIMSMTENLAKMGADIRVISATNRGGKTARTEKIIIQGRKTLIGANVKSFGDHRTAMSMVVAGLAAQGVTRIDDISCINKSFPNFLSLLKTIVQ